MTESTIAASEEATASRPSPTEVGAIAETGTVAEPAPTRRARRSMSGLIQTVGRRKEAVVRVRITPGTGTITCNGRPLEEYFPSKVHQQQIKDPLAQVERLESVDVFANLRGGGTTGQAGALRLAIARALCELDEE